MFKLTIETDNAAFEGACILPPGENEDDCQMHDHEVDVDELALLIAKVGAKIIGGHTEGTVMDSNGNSVGRWALT